MVTERKRPRILHLLLSLETGGMERFVYEHCIGIDKSRFAVSVCCIDRLGGFYDKLTEQGIRVDLLQKNQKRFDFLFPIRLGAYLRNNKIEIIHIHTGAFFHGSVAGFLARTPGIVYTEHGRHLVEPKVIYILDRISTFFADRIITVSSALERHLVENIGLPKKKIRTIANGVNTTIFAPRDKPQHLLNEFSIDSACKVVGTVGRLADIKDQSTLIKAFRLVKNSIQNSKLMIVGEGPCEEKLRLSVDEMELSEDVIFTGNRKDIPDILNIFDVYVLSSLMEGTSISLLEAMASGLPSVVTNVGGNTDIISDSVNGYVSFPGDHIHMSSKVTSLLQDRRRYKEFQYQSRKCILNHYNLEDNIDEYMSIYNAI